jgi:cytochrome c peroxidase
MMKTLWTLAALAASGSAFSVSPNTVRSFTKLFSVVEDSALDRRNFLSSSVAVTVAVASSTRPAGAEEPIDRVQLDYKAVANDIAKTVEDNPDWGPTLVRLAWHSSGTYDKMSKTGGSQGGTIRFKEELAHGGNAGLANTAVKWLEPIHGKYAESGLSYADLYTLAGVAAIKTMGGPTIPWSSGRVDEMDPSAVTPDGRLPNADSGPPGADPSDAAHLRTIFGRMGFDDREIVVLSGAHALGRCHPEASGYVGPWTATPTTFNNAYFTFLSNLDWKPKKWEGPYQYVAGPEGKGELMMLPTDLVLLQDKKFAKYVKEYAKDGQKFNKDFSKAFQKLEELGTKNLTPVDWA